MINQLVILLTLLVSLILYKKKLKDHKWGHSYGNIISFIGKWLCIDNVKFFYTVIYLQTIIYVSWFTLIITTLKVILKTCLLNSLFVVGLCSHWTEFDKISNVDQLGQMENSLRESLNQIRTRKVYTIIPSLVLLFQRYFYEFSLSSWS